MSSLMKLPQHPNLNLTFVEKDGEYLVDAESLRIELGVKTRFNDWINRKLDNPLFTEGKDFYSNLSKTHSGGSKGGRPTTEYLLTVDTAKFIATKEATAKGDEIAFYFIEFEKKAKEAFKQMMEQVSKPKLPNRVELAQMVLEEAKRADQLEKENKRLAPLAQASLDIVAIQKNIKFSEACKLIKSTLGRNKFIDKLRDWGMIFKKGTEPMQLYVDRGWFEVKTHPVYIEKTKETKLTIQTYVTPKGLIELHNRFEKAGLLKSQQGGLL